MIRALILDDDVAVTNFLTVFLTQTERYEPIVQNDPRQALALFEKERFDVMILDMDMPHLSGMDIMRKLKDSGIDVPIVVLTGVNDVDLAEKSLKEGVSDYLLKPVDEECLLEALDRASGRQINV